MIRKSLIGVCLFFISAGVAMGEMRLYVGTTGDYAPMTLLNEETGQYEGLSIDLIEEFARDRGYVIQYVQTTWPALIPGLLSDEYQVAVGGIGRTSDRVAVTLPSVPIALTGKVPVVRCGEEEMYDGLTNIDRTGTKVVVNRGGTNEDYALYTMRNATLVIVPLNHLSHEYVRDGLADVMFTEDIEALYLEGLDIGLCVVSPDRPYTRTEFVFLFNRAESALRDEFNEWFLNR